MNSDVEKINGLLQKEDFIDKLKADFSNKGIVSTFDTEGIKLTEQDAQEFKKTVIDLSRVPDDALNVSGGNKIGIEKGIHDTCEGAGVAVGSAVEGATESIWGLVKIPLKLAYDVGEGMYDGLKSIIK